MLTLIGCWKTFVSRCRFSLYMIYYLHNSCSGLSMNVGRCLRRKWLNLGIMNGKIFTNRGMLIIDMTLNLSGYALFDRQHSIIFSSGIFFFRITAGLIVDLVEMFCQVRRKDFWLLSTVSKVLKEFIPKLSHESDGLIFQVVEDQK